MFSKNEKALIWIDIFDFLTYHKQVEILKIFNEPSNVFLHFKNSYDKLKSIISAEEFQKMCYCLDDQFLTRHIVNLESDRIKILTIQSKNYPKAFLNYSSPPLILYCRGNLELLNTTCVAVVGTRRMTRYGKIVTENIVKELVSNGITIVSGLADGIDTVAHQTALENSGNTIAVLGSGLNEIYPHSNFNLSKQIEEKGLIISEYKPSIKPANYRFPIRNRIIVGISNCVLITEAGTKSGVMYTRDYCADYGVDLFVVPGNITNESSAGCNLMLKSCQASLTTSATDILQHLNITNNFKPKPAQYVQLSFEEQSIIDAIGNEEMHFDEILNRTKLDTKTLLSLLTTLELQGIIKKLAGNFYSK